MRKKNAITSSPEQTHDVELGHQVHDGSMRILYVDDLAQLFGVCTETVMRMLRTGELPGFKFGRRWVIHGEDFRLYLQKARRLHGTMHGDGGQE